MKKYLISLVFLATTAHANNAVLNWVSIGQDEQGIERKINRDTAYIDKKSFTLVIESYKETSKDKLNKLSLNLNFCRGKNDISLLEELSSNEVVTHRLAPYGEYWGDLAAWLCVYARDVPSKP